jgi:hypothetical protein
LSGGGWVVAGDDSGGLDGPWAQVVCNRERYGFEPCVYAEFHEDVLDVGARGRVCDVQFAGKLFGVLAPDEVLKYFVFTGGEETRKGVGVTNR